MAKYKIIANPRTIPQISTRLAARVGITALESVLPAQNDGENLCTGGSRLVIRLLPHEVEVVCPREVGA